MKEGYIKRATSTIPFGYELVDESSSFLKHNDEELEALQIAETQLKMHQDTVKLLSISHNTLANKLREKLENLE